jgi:hypothetical protein
MLIDPETLQITAIPDLEFTNAMPAEFTYDPWWLLLTGLDSWLESGAIDEFVSLYEPRMEQFLRALERMECERVVEGEQQAGGRALSTRMRDSWKTGRFWFDYAARKSFDVDMAYWNALHDGEGDGGAVLDDEEMECFTRMKMEQLEAYKEECTARFSSGV